MGIIDAMLHLRQAKLCNLSLCLLMLGFFLHIVDIFLFRGAGLAPHVVDNATD